MYKKRILGLAIASALVLTGCDTNDPDIASAGAVTPDNTPAPVVGVFPIFSPATGALPIPNDLIFDQTAADGSFAVTDSAPPVTTALNGLSGASTVAPIDIALSGLVMDSTVDGAPFLPDNVTPNPNQTVFLLELAYASGSPVQGLSNQEPPTIVGAVTPGSVEVITLDGRSTIRINPLEPLKPNTRYVVALTNGITDLAGDATTASPGVAGYSALSTQPATANVALDPVQALINGLWEPLATNYFAAATNQARAAFSLDPLDDTNITLSYSFTTSNDEETLGYINDPGTWITDRLVDLVKVTASTTAIAGGASDFASVQTVVDGAFNAWQPSSLNAALAGCDALAAGQARFDCAGATLFAALEGGALTGGAPVNFPDPEAQTITMNGVPTDVTVAVPALAASIPANTVVVDQGRMTIPYYSGLPTDFPAAPTAGSAAAGAGVPLINNSWAPDATLATTLNVAFYCAGLAIPQGNTAPALGSANQLDCSAPLNPADFTTPPSSTVINYIFPFPASQGDVTIPVMAIYPNPAAIGGATTLKTMIWGHGLTGNRSNALGYGSLLVASGVSGFAGGGDTEFLNAVIAIDEPLHGLDSVNPFNGSAFGATERHFGFQSAGTGVAPALFVDGAGSSGSMFINLGNFLTSRDNNRQHAVDLMTLRESLPATALEGHALTGNYFYSGHSLGTINSQAFVSVVNSNTPTTDDITAAAFFTPGGGITRFFENSPTFAPTIVDGLALAGFTPDTSSYQSFLNVLQGSLDAIDAVNFAADFNGTTPTLYFLAANDLVIPIDQSADDRTLQTTTGSGNTVSGSVSFLSGAEPLVRLAGATDLSTTPGTQAITQAVARYQPCVATHGTPSIPDGSDIPSAAFAGQAFAENLGQVVRLVQSDGASVDVGGSVALGGNPANLFQTLPLPALILDEATGCP